MSVYRAFPRRRAVVAIVAVALLALAMAASPAGAQTAGGAPQFASGQVTSVHGTSVQVTNQNQNSESTVVLSPTTQVTKRQAATLSAIAVGDCVRATGTGSAPKGITARTIALSAATSNGCTGGPAGFRPGNGQRPRNFGKRDGNGGGFRNRGGTRPANFALASGPVVSISGDSMVVKSTTLQRSSTTSTTGKSSKSAKNTKPKTTTSNVTVTVPASATITQTVAGNTADVVVGSCVTAAGTTSAGSVDAQRVVVSQTVNGSCSLGFGFGGRGGGGSDGTGGTGGAV